MLPAGIQRELVDAAVRTGVTPQLIRAKGWLALLLSDTSELSHPADVETMMRGWYERMDGSIPAQLADTEEFITVSNEVLMGSK